MDQRGDGDTKQEKRRGLDEDTEEDAYPVLQLRGNDLAPFVYASVYPLGTPARTRLAVLSRSTGEMAPARAGHSLRRTNVLLTPSKTPIQQSMSRASEPRSRVGRSPRRAGEEFSSGYAVRRVKGASYCTG